MRELNPIQQEILENWLKKAEESNLSSFREISQLDRTLTAIIDSIETEMPVSYFSDKKQ